MRAFIGTGTVITVLPKDFSVYSGYLLARQNNITRKDDLGWSRWCVSRQDFKTFRQSVPLKQASHWAICYVKIPLLLGTRLLISQNITLWYFSKYVIMNFFLWFDSLYPINNISVIKGWVFLDRTILFGENWYSGFGYASMGIYQGQLCMCDKFQHSVYQGHLRMCRAGSRFCRAWSRSTLFAIQAVTPPFTERRIMVWIELAIVYYFILSRKHRLIRVFTVRFQMVPLKVQ